MGVDDCRELLFDLLCRRTVFDGTLDVLGVAILCSCGLGGKPFVLPGPKLVAIGNLSYCCTGVAASNGEYPIIKG